MSSWQVLMTGAGVTLAVALVLYGLWDMWMDYRDRQDEGRHRDYPS